jgi:hypothetical protein
MTDDDTICTVQRLIDRGRLPGPVDESVWAIRRHLPSIATAEHAADLIARADAARPIRPKRS